MARATLETVLAQIKRNRAVAVRLIEMASTHSAKREKLHAEVKVLDKLEAALRKNYLH